MGAHMFRGHKMGCDNYSCEVDRHIPSPFMLTYTSYRDGMINVLLWNLVETLFKDVLDSSLDDSSSIIAAG